MAALRYVPLYVLCGLTPCFQVKGAPRCPVIASKAVAALAFLRDDFWGPADTRNEAAALWALSLIHI